MVQQFAQKAFIVRGDHILMVRKSSEDPHNPLRWEVPGGRMLFGEDIDDHIKREVFEETGIGVNPGKPFHVWQWVMHGPGEPPDQGTQVVALARKCSPTSFQISTDGRDESDHLDLAKWIPIEKLLSLDLIPSLRPAAEIFFSNWEKSQHVHPVRRLRVWFGSLSGLSRRTAGISAGKRPRRSGGPKKSSASSIQEV
ncbi:NUDIX domain-containing protein [Acrocarpospora catenulata]|uniref:NUDIX domain-containing protein n=1 Tax=Acrocarpospora catenulata TaxID=2836182 RepID=UPI0021132634|nr:NUDIX hydrolase [Acrocarpospora catenulata]